MSLTLSNITRHVSGDQFKIAGRMTFDSSYPTGGESLAANLLGLSILDSIEFEDSGGYAFDAVIAAGGASALIKAYRAGGFTPAGTITITPHADSAGTPAGSVSAVALNLATPAFSGTGYATAAQVVTTTDNQTMTLNECAGMWFIADGLPASPAVLILSNTAVTGAPAVLTCNGVPPVTNAGTYKIVKGAAPTFTGSALATHTHASTAALTGSAVAEAAFNEVDNETNLSTLAIDFVAYGK